MVKRLAVQFTQLFARGASVYRESRSFVAVRHIGRMRSAVPLSWRDAPRRTC